MGCQKLTYQPKLSLIKGGLHSREAKSELMWLSVDPMSIFKADGQMLPYSYVRNNPLRYIDPNGLWEEDADGNRVAQKGDSAGSYAKQYGVSQSEAQDFLSGQGYGTKENGNTNINPGDVVRMGNNKKSKQSNNINVPKHTLSQGTKSRYDFKAGKTYNLNSESHSYISGEGGLGGDIGTLEIWDKRHNDFIESFGIDLSYGVGASFITTFDSSEITFYQNVSGNNLLDVFSSTKTIESGEISLIIGTKGIEGYDSNYNMIWSINQYGLNISATIGISTGEASFEKTKPHH